MTESCPHVWERSDYILWDKHLPTPAPLITSMFLNTNPQDPPYSLLLHLLLHLQMLKITAWSFLTCWNLVRRRGRKLPAEGTSAHQSPWQQFDLSLGGCQVHSAYSGQVGDRGKVNRIRSLSFSITLSLSLSLPSADPGSSFDWISCELMRQAWRKASVVEISYHILICSLSDACACVILCFSLIELNARFSCVINNDKLALQLNCETKQSLIGKCVSKCRQRCIFSLD